MKHFTINAENNITVHASRKEAHETNAAVFSTEEQLADAIGNDSMRLIDIFNGLPGVTPVKNFTNRKIATERIWRAMQNLGGPAAIGPSREPEADATKPDPPTGIPAVEHSTATPEAETAAAEPVTQPPQPEPAPESVVPPASSEPSIPVADQQPEPAASQAQEPSVAPVEAPPQTTPFDEPVATVSARGADVAPTTPAATKKVTRSKKAPVAATNAGVPREASKTSRVIEMLKREGGATLEEIMTEMGWQQHTTRAMMSAGGSCCPVRESRQ